MNDKAKEFSEEFKDQTTDDSAPKVDKRTGIDQQTEDRLIIDLQGKLKTDISARTLVEQRWLDDARQYVGEKLSDEKTADAQRLGRSVLTSKLTKNLCNTGEARVADMVLPTEERNWALRPLVDPGVAEIANPETPSGGAPAPNTEPVQPEPQPQLDENGQPVVDPETGQPVMVEQEPQQPTESDVAQQLMVVQKERSDRMTEKIDNQFGRCAYESKLREIIHKAAIMGTAILKGPVLRSKRSRPRYVFKQDENGAGDWFPEFTHETSPLIDIVDAWHFYPDYQAVTVEECMHCNERIYMTPREFERFAKTHEWDSEKVKFEIDQGPRHTSNDNSAYYEFRQITQGTSVNFANRHELWEYNGEISIKHDLGGNRPKWWVGDNDIAECRIYYTNNTIFEMRLGLLETEEKEYKKFCWEDDPTSFWGQGVPTLSRTSSRLAQGALRSLSDNMGFARGPMVVLNTRLIAPVDGDWQVRALKVWKTKRNVQDVKAAVQFVDIPIHAQEFLAVLDRAEAMAREETSQPPIVSGEGAQYQTDRVGGLAILQNNVNIVDRRRLKSFDDCMITPLVMSFYHYNMQTSNDESIKGEYEVIARGSTELLAKHMRGQSVQAIAELVNHPLFGPMHKPYDTLRNVYESMSMDPDDYVLPRPEAIESLKAAQQAAQDAGGGDPNKLSPEQQLEMHEGKMQLEREKMEHAREIAELNRETKILEVISREDVTLAQVEAAMEQTRMTDKTNRDKMAAEIAVKHEFGEGI